MDPEWLPFGVLGRPHGVRGAIALRPFAPEGEGLDRVVPPLRALVVGSGGIAAVCVTGVQRIPGAAVLRIEGISSREAAASLTGMELRLARAELPALGPGEFYVEDLLGCEVVDTLGRHRGRVRGLYWNGAQAVLTIAGEDGEEALVPAVPAFIQAADPATSRVVIDFHD
jgi:16S rRNA processing protein RimM